MKSRELSRERIARQLTSPPELEQADLQLLQLKHQSSMMSRQRSRDRVAEKPTTPPEPQEVELESPAKSQEKPKSQVEPQENPKSPAEPQEAELELLKLKHQSSMMSR